MHRYLTDHAYGTATTDDLRQAFLDATGENLDWFWRQWIYSAGYPAFTVTAKRTTRQRIALTLVVRADAARYRHGRQHRTCASSFRRRSGCR